MQLDMEQLNALTPEQRNRAMALEKLFASPGWKYITALAKERSENSVQRAAFATTWADNRVAVGFGYAWNEILNLSEATEKAYFDLAMEKLVKADPAEISDEIDFE